MPLGSVLVIEDDGWVSSLLSTAIREAGYDVIVCGGAQEGLDRACADQPDCIICDVDLPDHDGYWVARNVRTHASRVSVTPFLFLSGLDDEKSRLEGFHVGADVYMTKPFRVDEVVAQIGALVQMAARLRVRRDSMISVAPDPEGNAIEGDLGQMSIATVLTVLEMERRTGVFEVVSKKRRAQLDMARGGVIDGMVGGTKVSALTALRTMLTWTVGRFSFRPTSPREAPQSNKSLGAFLIEALRLEDEAARDDLELPMSKRRTAEQRLAPPSLGGPASTPADLAPPSSRTPGFARSPQATPSLQRMTPTPQPQRLTPTPSPQRLTPTPSPQRLTPTPHAASPPLARSSSHGLTPQAGAVATPAAPPTSSAASRNAVLPLEPDLADWDIPEAMTPRIVAVTPLPKPPPLTIPRMTSTSIPPPTSAIAREQSKTPIPGSLANQRVVVPRPPPPRPTGPEKK
jgi:two-component system, OmpR family, response regulator